MENKEQKSANELACERTELAHSRNVLALERTDLAIERSVMAANRTLMAWVRTALSMIGFGFTIYKVLRNISQEQISKMPAYSPRRIGMFLIALGTISMILGTMEYIHTMKHLDRLSKRNYKPWNFATIAGFAVGLLGAVLIFSFLMHRDFF
jgi:putative membrane protein